MVMCPAAGTPCATAERPIREDGCCAARAVEVIPWVVRPPCSAVVPSACLLARPAAYWEIVPPDPPADEEEPKAVAPEWQADTCRAAE